jgi:hypothetical protein
MERSLACFGRAIVYGATASNSDDQWVAEWFSAEPKLLAGRLADAAASLHRGGKMADEELGTVPRALAVYPEILLGATPPDALDHIKIMLKWASSGESIGLERLLILSAEWIVRSLVALGESKLARDLSVQLITAGDAVAGLREHQTSRKLYVVRAELALADGDLARASDYERQATEWAMAHDHKDMLCETARVAARIALSESLIQEAIDRLDDGILIAQSCGYVLLHIDLRNTRAQA